MTNFADPDAYPVEGRGVAYSMAYFSAKHLGAGQYYLMTIVDKDGKPLRRRQHLSPERAGERAGQAVLVGDRLRPRDARADPRDAVVEPLVQHAGAAEERRRFGGRLLRPQGSRGQGIELGSDERRAESSKCCSASTARRKPFFDKTWKLPDIEKVS